MRLFTVSMTFLLILSACAPAAFKPTPVPAKIQPAGSEDSGPGSKKAGPPEFGTSVLATTWGETTMVHQLRLVDPASGAPVPGYAPIDLGVNYYYAFSPDRRTLAILAYESESPRNPVLHHIDLAAWQDTRATLEITGWAIGLAFSPDGRSVAVAASGGENSLLIFDLDAKRTAVQITPDFEIARFQFTSDGSALMTYGTRTINRFMSNEQTSGPPRAVLLDAQDLGVRWSVELAGVRDGVFPTDENAAETVNLHADPGAAIYFYPGLVFAPDRDKLHVVHADEEKLTTVDFGTRSVSTVDIQPRLSWFERYLMLAADMAHAKMANGSSRSAVISSDGATIYTIGSRHQASRLSNGDWEFTHIPLGLQVIDASDGSELYKLETDSSQLTISPDGDLVFIQSWDGLPGTDVFDAQAGEITMRLKKAILRSTHRMDGTPVLVSAVTGPGERTDMAAYAVDGELLGEWQVEGYGDWLIAP
jgi:hypothetical protein